MASNHLPTLYQEYIHLSRYSRWLHDKNRRETFPETVDRYFDFFDDHLKDNNKFTLPKAVKKELRDAVLGLGIMPSMRCLMTAGEALKKENVAGYNCAYLAIDSVRAFDEILYVLMNGTGVGFSVESKYVNQLPLVAEEFHETDTTIVVADSKLGWAKALKEFIHLLYSGQIPQRDTSKVRKAGSPLKTFGGRASGPEPLNALFDFCIKTFVNAAGRKLTTLECHDIVCKIAEIVVVGGVRRAALISLSDIDDILLSKAKSIYDVTLCIQTGNTLEIDYKDEAGNIKHLSWSFDPEKPNDVFNAKMIANDKQLGWWIVAPHRALANDSFTIEDTISVGSFMKEWLEIYNSKSGERGIYSRAAANNQAAKTNRRLPYPDFGVNPCSEIILRSREFCNLTEVVVREQDTPETLKEKVRLATILGTLQSTLTNFKYISKKWAENCNEERLLGVSLTGVLDNGYTNGKFYGTHSYLAGKSLPDLLVELKQVAIDTNKEWAAKLKIPESAAITCLKPSGTVSQLVDSASGIHARHSPYYIRTVRADKKDPLARMMTDMGFPVEDDVTKPDSTQVFSFPIKSPEYAIFRSDMSAIEQLELWLVYQRYYCEHKPSVTISVKEHEWPEVGGWVYNHIDEISGVSFLPHSDHIYKQAPYQDCTKEEYEEMLSKMPQDVDWGILSHYEESDHTEGVQQLACSSGSCELV